MNHPFNQLMIKPGRKPKQKVIDNYLHFLLFVL
jgi:hypothetical protein